MLLSNDQFLHELQSLFAARRSSGSVFITEKRMTFDGPATDATRPRDQSGDVDMADAGATTSTQAQSAGNASASEDRDERQWPCLIRATDGKGKQAKVKLSTLVQPQDYDTFSASYSTVLRQSFSTLRKKRKTKLPKKLASAQATSASGSAGASSATNSGQQSTKSAASKAATGSAGFVPRLTKVIGPRRGAGVEKRRALVRKRQKEIVKIMARRKRDQPSGTTAHAGTGSGNGVAHA